MTLQSAQAQLLLHLKKIYAERESRNITHWVMEHLTGKKSSERIVDKNGLLSIPQQQYLQKIQEELLTHRPVQYVLGEAWFAGMKFFVNEQVLIPRPETEELVDWVLEEIRDKEEIPAPTIFDMGTGSGCIAITVKKQLPGCRMIAGDINEEALVVARQNADTLGTDIELHQIDFLDQNNWNSLPVFDTIISNPPYIKVSERNAMAKHVLDFEPAVALFVPDEDPLLFYRKIAAFAKTHLAKGGGLFVEINEALGEEMMTLYREAGYSVVLKKDMQGHNRMLRATGND